MSDVPDHDPTRENTPRISIGIEQAIGALVMAAIACITFANVIVRYLTNISFAFTEEYSVALMVVVALLGTSLAMAGGRHIRIGYLVDGLAPPARRRAEMAAMALVVLCFGLLAWYGARLAWDEYRFEVLSSGLGNPQWLYTGCLPLLSLAVIGRAVGRMVRLARGREG